MCAWNGDHRRNHHHQRWGGRAAERWCPFNYAYEYVARHSGATQRVHIIHPPARPSGESALVQSTNLESVPPLGRAVPPQPPATPARPAPPQAKVSRRLVEWGGQRVAAGRYSQIMLKRSMFHIEYADGDSDHAAAVLVIIVVAGCVAKESLFDLRRSKLRST